jgi:hypothetical protein
MVQDPLAKTNDADLDRPDDGLLAWPIQHELGTPPAEVQRQNVRSLLSKSGTNAKERAPGLFVPCNHVDIESSFSLNPLEKFVPIHRVADGACRHDRGGLDMIASDDLPPFVKTGQNSIHCAGTQSFRPIDAFAQAKEASFRSQFCEGILRAQIGNQQPTRERPEIDPR